MGAENLSVDLLPLNLVYLFLSSLSMYCICRGNEFMLLAFLKPGIFKPAIQLSIGTQHNSFVETRTFSQKVCPTNRHPECNILLIFYNKSLHRSFP